MSTSLVNKTNAHPGGFLSSNEGPVVGCTGKGGSATGSCGIKNYRGLVGGKKRRKSRKKKRVSRKRRKSRKSRKSRNKRRRSTKKRKHRRKHRGGATMEPMNPRAGLRAIATRGGNGSRGLSAAEKRTLQGGSTHGKKSKIKYGHSLFSGGGTGYGMTADDAAAQAASGTPSGVGQGYHLKAGTSVTGYKNCGLIPSFKLGASSNFKGPADIQSGAGHSSVDLYNQYGSAGYGYKHPTPSGNKYIAGYHAPITSTSKSQKCGTGGRRKKKGGRTRKKKGGNLKQLMSPLTDAYSRVSSGLHRAGNRVGSAFLLSDKVGGGGCGNHSKSKKRMRKSKGKKQKGGYAQYGSNVPLTRTLQLPAGSQGGSWEGQLATPPTYTAGNFCHDNYNHFTGKGSPSPVLDQAAPRGANPSIL
jgi:hypothetical protein